MKRLLVLFPRAWRARYGVEFLALLEDSGGGWRVLFDVFREAFKMRVLSINFQFVTACALAGIIVAGVVAWRTPNWYISESVGQATSSNGIIAAEPQVLSRTALSLLIADLDLYPAERVNSTMEDVIAHLKRNLLVLISTGRGNTAFKVRFTDTDPVKAQKVTAAIMAGFAKQLPGTNVIDPASLPTRPGYPNREVIVAIGLAGGLALGLSGVLIRRRLSR